MAKTIKNIASSVHQRLLNKAKDTTRPFNELLLALCHRTVHLPALQESPRGQFPPEGRLDVFGMDWTGVTPHHGHRSPGKHR